MAKTKSGAETPEPEEYSASPTGRPVRVYLVQAADWNAGNTALGVGESDGWEMEPSGDGFMFRRRDRSVPGGKKAFWVPQSGIRFVEFLED